MKKQSFFITYQKVRNEEISLRELYQYHTEKITNQNQTINAIVTMNNSIEHELKILEEIDPEKRGILKGIPFVVKDSIYTKCCPTTSGDPDLKDFIPNSNADSVNQLLTEDGVILGKTNTPLGTLDVQTYNPLFGITNNPFNSNWTAGGSSGGTAAAIASEMVHLGLGSDLAGSLRIPASFCGIYSLRPTEGIISNKGHIPPDPDEPIYNSELVIGPMASSVFGIKLLMDALGKGSGLRESSFKLDEDIKLLVTSEFPTYPVDKPIKNKINELKTIISNDQISTEIAIPKLNFRLIKRTHKELSKLLLTPVKREKQITFDKTKTLENQKIIVSEQMEILEKYDAWILPVCSVLPFKHNLDHKPLKVNDIFLPYWKAMISYTTLFSVSGFPVMTIPISNISGKPLGIQLIAKPSEDYKLISLAEKLEQILNRHTQTQF